MARRTEVPTRPTIANDDQVADLKQRLAEMQERDKQRFAQMQEDQKRRIEEMQERIKLAEADTVKRQTLLDYCVKHGHTRANIRWAIAHLPLERISVKH